VKECFEIVLKREEAITILKELLDHCLGLDGHFLELASPNAVTSNVGRYQIIIGKTLNQKTKNCIQGIIMKHQLTYQAGSIWKTKRSKDKEPDTLIVYKPKK
jgi:hypothetical protein